MDAVTRSTRVPPGNAGRDTVPAGTRDRIVTAATELLAAGGRDAVSTRAVCAAAGVQAPTIYRLFGDKRGLLDAVALHGLATYVDTKSVLEPGPDPVEALRRGWDAHVGFGLANPHLYALAYGDARPGAVTPAARAGLDVLAGHVHRIAVGGRLRVPEALAAQLVHAAGSGTTLTLIATPPDRRDPALSGLARESTLAAVTTDRSPAGPDTRTGPDTPTGPDTSTAAAVQLRATLPAVTALTAAERDLLAQWLDRITAR